MFDTTNSVLENLGRVHYVCVSGNPHNRRSHFESFVASVLANRLLSASPLACDRLYCRGATGVLRGDRYPVLRFVLAFCW